MDHSRISHTKSSHTAEPPFQFAVVDLGFLHQKQSDHHTSGTLFPDGTSNYLDATSTLVGRKKRIAGSLTRRENLRQKKVLFVCCGLDGLDSKKFTFTRSKELGVRVFLLEDAANSLALTMEKEGIVERFMRVDMRPRDSLLDDVMAEILKIREVIGGFDGVCTFWDDAVGLCSRICERLGLPGNSSKSVDIAHDKHATRQCMREAGLLTPSSHLIKCEADVEEAKRIVGVPAILKPMYGASSLAVLKVDELDKVLTTYRNVVDLLADFYNEGELMGLVFKDGLSDSEHVEGFDVAPSKTVDSSPLNGSSSVCSTIVEGVPSSLAPESLMNSFSSEKSHQFIGDPSLLYVVMEEYLDGDEVDVDILLDNGEVTYQRVVDDWPQIEPWFVEMGNNCPSILPEAAQAGLAAMAVDTVKAMGFKNGILHVELKNTTKGPRLIEVNPRMGGGPVWRLHKMAFDVDFVEEQLYAACNLSVVPFIGRKPLRCVSCGEKFFRKSLVIPKEFCQVVRAMALFPNVVEATPLVDPGERIVGIDDGFPTRTARFVVVAETPLEAQEYAAMLLAMCDIPEILRAGATMY